MKTMLALALVAATAVPAAADDVHAKDADAAHLIGALRAGGVKLKKGKGKAAKKVTLDLTQLDCEISSNENNDPSDASAGVPDETCTALAPKKLTLRETYWLIEALGKLGVDLDCAMSTAS